MDFLPEGYESLRTEKNYLQLSKLKDGDTKLRIVMKPIAGWIDWVDKKPIRYRPNEKPRKSHNPEQPLKAFWACYVWDYSKEDLFVLEITQKTIQKTLVDLGSDPDWGDLTSFDVKIKKEGSGMETKYALTAIPHKPISEQIKQALKDNPVRLEALFEGGDPWLDLDDTPVWETKPGVITDAQYQALLDCIGSDSDAIQRTCERLDINSLKLIPVDKYPAIYNWAQGKRQAAYLEASC